MNYPTHRFSGYPGTWVTAEAYAKLHTALQEIADQDPAENALDPQWAARIAREAVDDHCPRCGADGYWHC